jgi:thiol:disulfide interchange protein
MPKPGRWMVAIKIAMGIVMVAIGAAFIWIAISRLLGRGGA